MKLKELLDQSSWYQVINEVSRFFPEYIELLPNFQAAYQELKTTVPETNNIRLVIGLFDQGGVIPFYMVGFDGGCPKGFSLKFSSWDKWLGAEVSSNNQQEFSADEIIAICLIDMAWAGFLSEEVIAFRNGYIAHKECLHSVLAYIEDIEASEPNLIKRQQRSNEFHEALGLRDFEDIIPPDNACEEYMETLQEMEVQAYCLGESETDYDIYCEKLSALRDDFTLKWPNMSNSSTLVH